jgi:hypothetical protein
MHCSYWDFLPSEIKLLIFSFDPTHFFNFKPSLNSIPLSGTKSRLLQLLILYNNDLINPIRNHSYSSFPHLLSDFVNDHEYMLSILHTCKCCPRHQNRRPFSTINHLTNLNYNPQLRCGYCCCCSAGYPCEFKNKCLCRCRKHARDLCRSFMLSNSLPTER